MSAQITDSAPSDVTMEVAALAADLDTVVPAKTNENLLIENVERPGLRQVHGEEAGGVVGLPGRTDAAFTTLRAGVAMTSYPPRWPLRDRQ